MKLLRMPVILLCALIVVGWLPGAAGAAAGEDAEKLLSAVESAARRDNDVKAWAEGMEKCDRLLAMKDLPTQTRQQVLLAKIRLLARQKNGQEAQAVLESLRNKYPDDAALQQESWMAEYSMLRILKKEAAAAAKISEAAQRFAADKAYAAKCWTRAADALFRTKDWEGTYNAAQKALQADALTARTEQEGAYFYFAESASQLKKYEECVAALEPTFDSFPDHQKLRHFQDRYLDCLGKLKKYERVRNFLLRLQKERPDWNEKQVIQMRLAQAYAEEQKLDEALAACEKVFTDYPQVSDQWWWAQSTLVDLLRRKGEDEKAFSAARVLLDAAGDMNSFQRTAQMLGDMVRERERKAAQEQNGKAPVKPVKDKNAKNKSDSGRELMAWLAWGPGAAGEGKTTVEAIPYPDLSARRKAFAAAEAKLGFEADDLRQRARMRLYSGEPAAALPFYLDGLRRCAAWEYSRNYTEIGREMIWSAVRARRGYVGDLTPFFVFLVNGPAGPDGKTGTADDLPDPFGAWKDLSPQAPLLMPSGDDLQQLLRAQAYFKRIADDAYENTWHKQPAVSALRRIHEALAVWADPQWRKWYLDLGSVDTNRGMQEHCLCGWLASAKGGAYHMGGVQDLLPELARLTQAESTGVWKSYQRFREAFAQKQTLPEKFAK